MGGEGESTGPRQGLSIISRAELDVRGVAEMTEIQALFRKLGQQRNEEAADSGGRPIDYVSFLKPDFSHLTDEQREQTEKEIADLRADPTFRAELKSKLEPELARLMDD